MLKTPPLCTLLPADWRPSGSASLTRYLCGSSQAKDLPTFKDNDFLNEGQKLRVGEESKKNFLEKLKRDVEVPSNFCLHPVCGPGAPSESGTHCSQQSGERRCQHESRLRPVRWAFLGSHCLSYFSVALTKHHGQGNIGLLVPEG